MSKVTLSVELTKLTNPWEMPASVALREQAKVLCGIRRKFNLSIIDGACLIDVASILEGLAQDAERKEGTRK